MKKIWKISGIYLFAVGIIHVLLGIAMFQDALADILNAGVFNSISDEMDRNAAFWFIFAGLLWIYIGWQWHKQIGRDGLPPSRFAALGMTVMTAAGVVIMPASGFWLLLPLCIIMLYPHFGYSSEVNK